MRRIHPYLLLLTLLLTLSCHRVRLSDARGSYVRGEYHEAVTAYRSLYRQTARQEGALRGVIAFEMAENYRQLNRSGHAATAYANAIRHGYPDKVALLRLGQMLHRAGDYSGAVDAYNTYLTHLPDDPIALEGLQGARQSMDDSREPAHASSRYRIRRMDLFNSSRSDFSPLLAHDDEWLYFTSSREEIPGDGMSSVTGTKYHDLYQSRRNSHREWQKPERIESPLNTAFDEGVASVTANGDLMFYSVTVVGMDQPALPGIYLSRRTDGAWSAGKRLAIPTDDTLALFAHPATNASGSLLFFVSDMSGGEGGKDIWVAHLDSRQEVVRIEHAGAAVNTPGDEMFPTLRDDTVLYFSSNGHPGRGGLDLFRAVKDHNGKDWQLLHLPSPLNSSADDFGITFEQGKERGFFSSNRDDARGYDHIYAFERVERMIQVEGYVADRSDRLIPGAIIDVVGSDGSRLRLATNREGLYHFNATEGVAYLFLAQAEGFLNQKQSLAPIPAGNDTICAVDFEMTPYNRPVILEHIFYDFNGAVLREESKKELDNLLQIMGEHPEIRVELSAHTDRIGADSYNEGLSLRRAQSVIDYLTKAGVSQERLLPMGQGKRSPKRVDKRDALSHPFLLEGASLTEAYIATLLPAQQAVADQLNRRTEFRVLLPTGSTPR